MTRHIIKPTRIQSVGNIVKIIDEFIGIVNSQTKDISIAKMQSPAGWEEPAQKPEFDEYTLVLKGNVHVKSGEETFIVKAGEVFFSKKGDRVQYSTPDPGGAEYLAICIPAFSPNSVHREKD